jgi:hypothetical protein
VEAKETKQTQKITFKKPERMRTLTFMLLAIILVSCVTREPAQYHGELVELIEIKEEWRLAIDHEYHKQLVYIYRTYRGEILELSYPLNDNRIIGSNHLMPIQR